MLVRLKEAELQKQHREGSIKEDFLEEVIRCGSWRGVVAPLAGSYSLNVAHESTDERQ